MAAKKSRVKQSLIKRARSVAIFSLKLKERRAREAEKHAYEAAETEKVCYERFVLLLNKNDKFVLKLKKKHQSPVSNIRSFFWSNFLFLILIFLFVKGYESTATRWRARYAWHRTTD